MQQNIEHDNSTSKKRATHPTTLEDTNKNDNKSNIHRSNRMATRSIKLSATHVLLTCTPNQMTTHIRQDTEQYTLTLKML